jgi:hypothetical protein
MVHIPRFSVNQRLALTDFEVDVKELVISVDVEFGLGVLQVAVRRRVVDVRRGGAPQVREAAEGGAGTVPEPGSCQLLDSEEPLLQERVVLPWRHGQAHPCCASSCEDHTSGKW